VRDARPAGRAEAAAARPAKLSFKEKRELEQLPATIETLEARKQELEAAINAPDFHMRGAIGMAEVAGALEATEAELETVMARWLDLEARAEVAR
jgi:ATP-binding cassette subfamily F protein uup